MQFAEFLNEGFLAHLRILSLPTCVGFSTGKLVLVRGFSWQDFLSLRLVLRLSSPSVLGFSKRFCLLTNLPP